MHRVFERLNYDAQCSSLAADCSPPKETSDPVLPDLPAWNFSAVNQADAVERSGVSGG